MSATQFDHLSCDGHPLGSVPSPHPWYALRVRSNFEWKTAQVLKEQGYDPFVPAYQVRSFWSDRVKLIDKPLFPGYVLCRFDRALSLPILKTPGVVHVVACAGEPLPLDEAEVSSVRAMVSSPVSLFPRAFMKVGQRVRITRGPLQGIEGILESFRNSHRIVVSISLLMRSVAAEIDAEWVTALPDPRDN